MECLTGEVGCCSVTKKRGGLGSKSGVWAADLWAIARSPPEWLLGPGLEPSSKESLSLLKRRDCPSYWGSANSSGHPSGVREGCAVPMAAPVGPRHLRRLLRCSDNIHSISCGKNTSSRRAQAAPWHPREHSDSSRDVTQHWSPLGRAYADAEPSWGRLGVQKEKTFC